MISFPIYIKDESFKEPDDDIYYIIGQDGIFLKKKTGLMESLVAVNGLSFLEDVNEFAQLHVRRIPQKEWGLIISFFKEVYDNESSEAVLLLYYNEEKNKWKINAPFQTITAASVNYVTTETFKGFTLVGSIHSHARMGAFHSGVDDNDEENFDGLHITIGNLDEEYQSISTSIVSNGKRFKVKTNKYICGVEKTTNEDDGIVHFGHFTRYLPAYYQKTEKLLWKTIVPKKYLKFPNEWLKRIIDKRPQWKRKKYVAHQYQGPSIKNKAGNHGASIFPGRPNSFFINQSNVAEEFEIINTTEDNPCGNCVFKNKKTAQSDEKIIINDVDNDMFNPDASMYW